MLTDEEIQARLTRCLPDLDRAAHELVAAANERGGEDNITVLLIRFEP